MDSNFYAWTLGTLLIGVFFNTFLFGVNSYQFGIYFHNRFNDPTWLRIFVVVLCVIDVAHSALTIFVAWFYCIENYTVPEMLAYPLPAYCLTPILEAIPAIITHSFLATRVRKVIKSEIVFGGIMVLSLLTFVFGLATGIKALFLETLTDAHTLYNLCVPWLAFQAATNIALTAALSWILAKRRPGNKQIECNIIQTAPRALEIGFPATIFATMSLITYLAFGSTSSNLYASFALPLGRIYTLIILDILNARKRVKADEDIPITTQPTFNKDEARNSKRLSLNASTAPKVDDGLPIVRVTTPSIYTEEREEYKRNPKRLSSSTLGNSSGAGSSDAQV